jgi:hypothetical protein
MRLLFLTALGAVGLLGIATTILARYNWNDKLAGQLISVAIVGTATAFVTVVLSFRDVSDDWAFSTSVAIDQLDGKPPRTESGMYSNRITWRAKALADTSRSFPEDAARESQSKTLHGGSEPFNYVSELLQYQIVNDIREMQTNHGTSMPVAKRGNGVAVFTTRLKNAKRPTNVRAVPATQWNSAVQSNRFVKSFVNAPWDEVVYTIPEGVTLELGKFGKSGASDPPLYYTIRLARAGYFEFTISIYTASANDGGVIPNGLQIDDIIARRCQLYYSDIWMHLHIERLTSGGDLSAAYERWLREMAAEVEARWSDVRNTEQP